jgi:DNA-binding PadR family transcriptional regulator
VLPEYTIRSVAVNNLFLEPFHYMEGTVLELAILGLLHEEQVHGYELRRRLSMLIGRPFSEGGFYSAISRLKRRGFLTRRQQPGNPGLPRQVLSLTPAGAEELVRRVRSSSEQVIADQFYFFALLAFYNTPRILGLRSFW